MQFHVLLVLALTCVIGFGQETVQSPEVHADKTFTLRLSAPKASEVTVAGEWNLNKPQALSKDDKGVWTIKVGPVPPNIYIYTFNVDGVTITDPINPSVKAMERTGKEDTATSGQEGPSPCTGPTSLGHPGYDVRLTFASLKVALNTSRAGPSLPRTARGAIGIPGRGLPRRRPRAADPDQAARRRVQCPPQAGSG